jgi:tetratricopeptide (TPR) repeat protein
MKFVIGLAFVFITPGSILAQSVEEGRKLLNYERYNGALNSLQTAIKQSPADGEAWYWLSQAYLELKQPHTLKDTLAYAPPEVVNSPVFDVIKGQLLLRESKMDSARFYFDRALKATKEKNPFILSAVARAHVNEKAGDGNYAIELLKKAGKRDKKNPSIYTLSGDAYRKLANGSEAYKMYQQAIETDPQYAAAAHKLGRIFVSQKNNVYLKYFNQAIAADSMFAPVYYDLYYHYYFIDPVKALDYFNSYISKSDYKQGNEYLLADLLYINKRYEKAIEKTKDLLSNNGVDTMPRLYKLLAYSYAGLQDTSSAIQFMYQYLLNAADSNHSTKDYELMADLYAASEDKKDSAMIFYRKVLEKNDDSTRNYVYYKKLADLARQLKDYVAHADFMGKYYQSYKNASNLDLFNWGIAHFKAEEYPEADSVFALYSEKYPEQSYGYYWRARSNALMDSTMETGSAIPHYKQLITVIEKDTSDATNKKWLIEAYGYIAAYETNKEKNYENAIEYLEKVLELDPANKNALEYIALLEKTVDSEKK